MVDVQMYPFFLSIEFFIGYMPFWSGSSWWFYTWEYFQSISACCLKVLLWRQAFTFKFPFMSTNINTLSTWLWFSWCSLTVDFIATALSSSTVFRASTVYKSERRRSRGRLWKHVTAGIRAQVQQPDSQWHLNKPNFKQKQINELWWNYPFHIDCQIN